MTVKQLEKKFKKEQGGIVRVDRRGLNREFACDIIRQWLTASDEYRTKDAVKHFTAVLDNIHIKFGNFWLADTEKEWRSFYAAVVVPMKIAFGMSIPYTTVSDGNGNSDTTKQLNVNHYVDATLTTEQKESLVACGLNKPYLTRDICMKQFDLLPFAPVENATSYDFAIFYLDILTDGVKNKYYNTLNDKLYTCHEKGTELKDLLKACKRFEEYKNCVLSIFAKDKNLELKIEGYTVKKNNKSSKKSSNRPNVRSAKQ